MPEITLRANFHRERDQWIGWCPDLDVTTQGDTRREAEENLREAVSLFLETCQEMGTLEDVLREAKLFPGLFPGLFPLPEVKIFRIPSPLLVESRKDSRASAPTA